MKKIIIIISLLAVMSVSVYSQADFSGSADITLLANIPESDSYDSLLNPGNVLGIQDFVMIPSLIAKLDAGDESSTFSAWFLMKEYPIGQGLLAASYGDSIQTGSAYELISAFGDSIYTFDLMRLSANVYLTDNISMEIGRQSMVTGYGYGWNPIEFANPLKNPAYSHADLRGVDGLVFRMYPGDITSLKLYGILPDTFLTPGLDYEEIKAGGEATFYLPGMELKLAGFWDYDNTEGSDPYTPSAGAALMLDFFGIGVYGEASFRKGVSIRETLLNLW
ncbi:MAG: hypothetical protein L3J12_10490 [Spirochaetales bacterium]|nr:hypothetical protein [Spirochaetales bacterium]